MEPFKAVDLRGNDFWVDFDGAEGIGFWVGDPEGTSAPLSHDDSQRLIKWFRAWYISTN